jgi:hypothetical protein
MKQTIEVSGHQTPGACSSIHVAGTCQSQIRPVQSLRQALQIFMELSCSTPPFLTLCFYQERSDVDYEATPSLTNTPSARVYSFSPLKVIWVTWVSRVILSGLLLLGSHRRYHGQLHLQACGVWHHWSFWSESLLGSLWF